MSKCTMCIDKLEQGEKPVCVMACFMRALDFDPLEEMQKKYGTLRQLEEMPNPDETKPSIVFKPNPSPANKLLPYNADKALELLAKREVAVLEPCMNDADGLDCTIIVVGQVWAG